VAVDVDAASGTLAIGYYDPTDGSVWLGSCPATCPDGPTLNPVGSWPRFSDGGLASPYSLKVVAGRGGPAAVLTAYLPGTTQVAAAYGCADIACTEPLGGLFMDWAAGWPVVDGAGNAFIVGNTHRDGAPVLLNVHTRRLTPLAGEGIVRGAAFGPDGRLRMLLEPLTGGQTLVTCTCPADR
jgi:hypothetical protein